MGPAHGNGRICPRWGVRAPPSAGPPGHRGASCRGRELWCRAWRRSAGLPGSLLCSRSEAASCRAATRGCQGRCRARARKPLVAGPPCGATGRGPPSRQGRQAWGCGCSGRRASMVEGDANRIGSGVGRAIHLADKVGKRKEKEKRKRIKKVL